jgi:hypothetical protein
MVKHVDVIVMQAHFVHDSTLQGKGSHHQFKAEPVFT